MLSASATPGPVLSIIQGRALPIIDAHICFGSASYLLSGWDAQYGIVGMYELFVRNVSRGAFLLMPDGTFRGYHQWVEITHLPPEPQHAMTVVMRDPGVGMRDLVCPVYRVGEEGESGGFYLYQKCSSCQTGKYVLGPMATLIEVLRATQLHNASAILIPFRIQ